MEPFLLLIPGNPQNHLPAQKCQMEPEDLQWDEGGLFLLIKTRVSSMHRLSKVSEFSMNKVFVVNDGFTCSL